MVKKPSKSKLHARTGAKTEAKTKPPPAAQHGAEGTAAAGTAGTAESHAHAHAHAQTHGHDAVIKRLEAECAELKEKMMRALAEAENTRHRSERDIAQAQKYAHSGFVRDLSRVVENLMRAVEAIPPQQEGMDQGVKNLVVGIQMVVDEMHKVLTQHGITRITPTPMRDPFDPSLHQAMQEVETSGATPGTIIAVAQAGWMLHDRLLLPAMVSVAKPPAASTNATAADTAKQGAKQGKNPPHGEG